MIQRWNRLCRSSAAFAALAALLTAPGVAAKVANHTANAPVDKVFSDLQKPGSPGCALGVYRNGQIIYSKGYGLASVELNAPIAPDSVFDIGSTSKQFTAASILLLEQQGKLSLNDDVRKYIPELPDYGHKITILNLLNHTSGLRDYLELLFFSGVNIDSVTTDEDALALVARQKNLNFTPGTKFLYSNTGFFLLSLIVKRVSGMTLEKFALQNIFQPLAMTHTTFRDDHTMLIPHRALAYDPASAGGYKLNVSYFEQTGDGAVHTSVQDLVKWDENFYSGQVGGKRLPAEMQVQGTLNNGKKLDYAKALFIGEYRGLRTVRHGGAWGGYRAELLRFPDQHFSVACLCNLSNANPERRAEKVADAYLGTLMTPAKPEASTGKNANTPAGATLTSQQMANVVGMYRNADNGDIARVSSKDGKLEWEIFGRKFGLRALSPTEFLPVKFPLESTLTFDLNANHSVSDLKVGGDKEIAATYQKVAEFLPSPAEIAAFAGDYYSEELGVIYRLKVQDGKLSLVAISQPNGIPRTGLPMPNPMRPTVRDEFELSSLGLRAHFLKDANHDAIGFDLQEARAGGVLFLRTDVLQKH
ncbi:MAG: serine hydrolase domain-containing protein [Acidobacteriaceae bacterium]